MKKYAVSVLVVGLLAGCGQRIQSVSQKFNELPPAVQKTARVQAPNDEITDVARKTQNGRDVFELTFREAGRTPKIVVAADGTLLSTDFATSAGVLDRYLTPTGPTGAELSALPELAQRTIKSRAPNAEIAGITRHESNGRAIYEVEFRDKGKNPTLRVAEDGTLVQDLQK
jgi:uncharacterized membrane protein YkoI